MNALLMAVGIVVLTVTVLDLVWTTLASSAGAGPITRIVTPFAWRRALAIHRRRPSHGFLTAASVMLLLAVMALWIALTLVGWWLVTLGGGVNAIVEASTGANADAVDRLYFTGYTLFTLGIGDFRPQGDAWQMATVAMTGSGLVLITLTISYLVPVATAAASQRQLSTLILSLGDTPDEILVRGWDGGGFSTLESHLTHVAPMVHAAGQAHLTYPVLHYLHPTDPRSATPNAIATLALALELLDAAVDPSVRPATLVTEPCRQGVRLFLRTLRGAHIEAAREPVPIPNARRLQKAGIAVVAEEDCRRVAEESREMRRLLAGLLIHTGWDRDHS